MEKTETSGIAGGRPGSVFRSSEALFEWAHFSQPPDATFVRENGRSHGDSGGPDAFQSVPCIDALQRCIAALQGFRRFGRSPSGGNGGLVQYWYVGYDPTQDVIIVAHEGTNSKNLTADLTNLLVTMDPLDSTLFPDVPADVLVHTGYQLAHARTAPTILSNVKTALEQHPGRDIVITGHSLGAVLSLLDAVYLPMHLPDTVKISTIGYGLPRLGNKAFADYVDANVNLTHITYQHDPFPTLPFRLLGFQQPSHEVHIDQNNNWVECPGQENQSTECIDGAVPDLLIGRFEDHEGPYDGVVMGLGEC